MNADSGVEKALSFVGFKNEILLASELISHSEQLYKAYIVDENFDYHIKKSIPEGETLSADAFFFKTKYSFKD